MNFIGPTIFLTIVWSLAGCCTQRHAVSTNNPKPAIQNLPSYTRIDDSDTNALALQLAAREFRPAHRRGPVIWLVGAMHVGEPAYYGALQKFLDAQTVVLYEGINTDTHPRHVPQPGESVSAKEAASSPSGEKRQAFETQSSPVATAPANAPFSMQAALAHSLGLVFQLDAIDYDHTNFLNSDLSVMNIQRLMITDTNVILAPPDAPPETTKPVRGNPTFDALLQVMDGSSFLGSLVKVGIQFIGANPKLQAVTKLSLIEAIGDMKGDMATMRGMPPDMSQLVRVLIQARNQRVVADLQTELKRVPRSGSIAIFYGTGHMEDMEKRMMNEFHYKYAGEKWFTAFSVDYKKSNLSPAEVHFTRTLVKSQMEQMQ